MEKVILIDRNYNEILKAGLRPRFKVLLFILLNSWFFFLPIGYAFSSPNKGIITDLSFGMSEKEVTEGMLSPLHQGAYSFYVGG